MFGIGFPELILILALALIVVGPDKLPDLARSVAKTLLDLKKTAEGLKESFTEEDNPLSDIKPQLEDAAKNFKDTVLDAETKTWKESIESKSDEVQKNIKDIYGDYADMIKDGENPDMIEPANNNSTNKIDQEKVAKAEPSKHDLSQYKDNDTPTGSEQ